MVEFGFIQTVKDNMKLFSKRQIAGAVRAKDLYEKMIFPSTADFRAIVSADGIPGCEVTPEDVKTAKVIWGRSGLKMKGNSVRRNAKRLVQSVIRVPSELFKLQQDVELAIDLFFINKHAFFTSHHDSDNNVTAWESRCFMHGTEVCEVDEQRFAQMCRHSWHDHAAIIFQGSRRASNHRGDETAPLTQFI